MANWTVKVIRSDNPTHDTAGTSAYAVAVDTALGSSAGANVAVASAWDPETGGIVTTVCIADG
jgi:hypothetical protein